VTLNLVSISELSQNVLSQYLWVRKSNGVDCKRSTSVSWVGDHLLTLPSSTPIWSYELIPQMAPWTWILCSAKATLRFGQLHSLMKSGRILRLTVKGDQASQSFGGELLEQDRVGRLVAGKDLALDKSLVLGLLRAELFSDLLLGLSECKSSMGSHAGSVADVAMLWHSLSSKYSLGLSEEVGQQDVVVVTEGVLSLDGGQEVTGKVSEPHRESISIGSILQSAVFLGLPGDQLGSLVDKLVESVLLETVGRH
jgi:hypothetical protein